MKKRMYRAIDVKKVQVEKLADQVRSQRVVVGIDVAKEVQYASFVLEDKEVLLIMKWNQLVASSNAAALDLLKSLPASRLEVALEPSGSYGDPLRHQLKSLGIGVFRVSPKRCKDYSEVYDGVPSQHDGKSAVLLSRLHLEGMSDPWTERSVAQRDLAVGVNELDIFEDQFHRNVNRLEGQMARYWPDLSTHISLGSATVLELLARFGGPEAVASSPVDSAVLMRKCGGHFLKESKIGGVIKSAQSRRGVAMTSGECSYVKALAQECQRNRKHVKTLSKRLEGQVDSDPVVANWSPMMGKRTAIVMSVKGGDPYLAAQAASYVKSLGLNLKERSSGRYKGQLRLTKRGSGVARRWLYMLCLRLVQRDAVVKAWYRKKVQRDGGLKMKALGAVMRKVASAMWHVARGSAFDSSKLFDVRRLGEAVG
jgi:transposase